MIQVAPVTAPPTVTTVTATTVTTSTTHSSGGVKVMVPISDLAVQNVDCEQLQSHPDEYSQMLATYRETLAQDHGVPVNDVQLWVTCEGTDVVIPMLDGSYSLPVPG
jgi:hypothetical protein